MKKNARALHEILEDLKQKGITIPEPEFKRVPVGFDKDNKYSYLARYKGLLVYKTFKPNKTFHSKKNHKL